MVRMHEQVIYHSNDGTTNGVAKKRQRLTARPIQRKLDPVAFARKIEARYPLLMAELAK